jgi:hypothetical protein
MNGDSSATFAPSSNVFVVVYHCRRRLPRGPCLHTAGKRLRISCAIPQPPEEVESALVCLGVVVHVDIGRLFVGDLCEVGGQIKASRNILIGSNPEYSVQSMTWFWEESIYSRCWERSMAYENGVGLNLSSPVSSTTLKAANKRNKRPFCLKSA